MANESGTIIQRLWNYCNVLRDDGVSYGDYVEQLTYLLFLKMADERENLPPLFREISSAIPEHLRWKTLRGKSGTDLEEQYKKILAGIGKHDGMLKIIFQKSQNKIQDPAKLERLISLIDENEWLSMTVDVKGDIYEGLLQKNAEDIKSGAGQYFTPRPLIRAIVDVIRPKPGETISDPACGTGGFFLEAYRYLSNPDNYQVDKDQKHFLKYKTFKGWELVSSAARLCMMNLYLHGIEQQKDNDIVIVKDSLLSDPTEHFDIVLTNPPFGKKSSITIAKNEKGKKSANSASTYERDGFWTTTSNKQLNFVQHVYTLLKINGRAAVVVPDNVLFEGGAGETVRKQLLHTCNVHTLLRLPTGVFYAQGVKANVLFFDRKPASETPWTEKLWIYDLRTNKRFTLKSNPLKYEDLKEFAKCYHPITKRKETERFKCFTYDGLIQRDKVSLDIFWLKDESLEDAENLPAPDVLAKEIVGDLEIALAQFKGVCEGLGE